MPCPRSSGVWRDSYLERREFMKSVLVVGGAAALSACIEREGMPAVKQGVTDLSTIPERQYAWNGYLPKDVHGNLVPPDHQVILFLEYTSDHLPTTEEREQVENALRTVERAYPRGNGGTAPQQAEGSSTDGVLFTLGYAPSYFDQFDEDLPGSVDLPPPERVLSALNEPTTAADQYDAALVLVSDHAQVLLAIEQALFGNLDSLNGVEMDGGFDGVFEKADRRTGFKGPGMPREQLGIDEIPTASPAAMGFKSGFRGNQASENSVAIRSGPFADGTTQHISQITFDLDNWYSQDRDTQAHQMFSPEHTVEEIGEVGEFLASDSNLTSEIVRGTGEYAERDGLVGHTQKVARARNDDFEPIILRRSEAITTDTGVPGMNFTSVQQDIEDFVETRKAMNGGEFEDQLEPGENGILEFIEVMRRANFLVPPRQHRALPSPEPQ